MATLVLTAVGTLIGGPIGGALGALVGSQLDQRLLAPTVQRGPRLGDLSVQTSSYGQPLPKLFGTMRAAGSVIWATDLKETRSTSGGGKGQPKIETYSYSASFAVALSGRPILGIGRIWADGKLLRGLDGDWKSETGYRLYPGDEDAAVDPLLAAAEGGVTPACRGLAYAVFEEFQLADYGNRIPSLSFEIEADPTPVQIGAIAAALSDGAVVGATVTTVGGYAASGDSVRSAIEALGVLAPLGLRDVNGALTLAENGPLDATIAAADLGAAMGEDRLPQRQLTRAAADTLPDEVTLGYYDPLRDYQAGLQRARRGGPGRLVETDEVAAALTAEQAKAAAEARLARAWAARRQATLSLPWSRLDVAAGDSISVDGLAGRWRVSKRTLEKMVLGLELESIGPATQPATGATAGRATTAPDLVQGPTVLALLDLPPLDETAQSAPRLHVAAAGTSAGWRRAALVYTLDGGASYVTLGGTAVPAIMGATLAALPDGSARVLDQVTTLEVQLLNAGMWLASADDGSLVAGGNAAVIGDELVQFGVAVPIAPGRFRLSRLLRGRRGTEWAMAGHTAGERFVLLDQATLAPVDLPLASLGATLGVVARGIGDPPEGAAATRAVEGRALAPPAPVGVRAQIAPDGAVALSWIRRSRIGWAWIDGADAPLGEEQERYRVRLTPDAGSPRELIAAAPTVLWDAAARAADGATSATSLRIDVTQLGLLAESRATSLVLPLS